MKTVLAMVLFCGIFFNRGVSTVTSLDEVIATDKPVVVDFFATWCGPCRKLDPEYKKWSERHSEAIFVKVNIDVSRKLVRDYNVSSVPQLFVVKGDRMIRLPEPTEARIVEAIKALEKR